MIPKVGQVFSDDYCNMHSIFMITNVLVNEKNYVFVVKTIHGFPNIASIQVNKKDFNNTWNKYYVLIPNEVVIAKLL